MCTFTVDLVRHTETKGLLRKKSANKGVNQRSKDVTGTQEQRPKWPTVTQSHLAGEDVLGIIQSKLQPQIIMRKGKEENHSSGAV